VLDRSRLEAERGLQMEELFSGAGLEQYASSLAKEDKTAAARHVRSYKERLASQ